MNEQSYSYGATKSSIRELAAYAAARKAEIGAENVFDFSLGNPSIPAPDAVRVAIERALTLPSTQLHGYTPAAGLPDVRAAIAASLCRRFGDGAAAADGLYLTCGAAACLSICLNALLNPGDEVIVIAPYFPEYRVWIETAGGVCVEVPANEATFEPDVDAIEAAITDRTRAVIVNSPNNPTGAVYSAEVLERLAAVLDAHDVVLIADEPYRELVYGAEVPWIPAIYARTLVCYSYSKSLSLPGERIGWVLVPPAFPDFARMVPAVAGAGRKLGFVCAPALFQRVIAECVDVPANVDAYAENNAALTAILDECGYEYVVPRGAFYLWIRALEPDAQAFSERAKDLELMLVASDSFGVPGWVRAGTCVSRDTIDRSAPAWAALAASYR
ncbi:MAG: pyridoxal phosphate-dependent aminotransferase [Atopobiaceae bacterium]|nr:pyridoxal phosphate-dependent aminotransferase [Atopobiaceae bacterium]